MTVPENDVPPLKLSPILVAVLESNPPETVPTITHDAALLNNPVVARLCWARQIPESTADVPLPTERQLAITSNVPVSAAAVPAPNVNVILDVSEVVPRVPVLSVMIGVAVPALVLTISNTQRYCPLALKSPALTCGLDPVRYVSVAKAADWLDVLELISWDGYEANPDDPLSLTVYPVPATAVGHTGTDLTKSVPSD